MSSEIPIIGGRSKIGAALIRELVGKGEPLRALVRATESKASFPEGVRVVTGDLADPSSLRSAIAVGVMITQDLRNTASS